MCTLVFVQRTFCLFCPPKKYSWEKHWSFCQKQTCVFGKFYKKYRNHLKQRFRYFSIQYNKYRLFLPFGKEIKAIYAFFFLESSSSQPRNITATKRIRYHTLAIR